MRNVEITFIFYRRSCSIVIGKSCKALNGYRFTFFKFHSDENFSFMLRCDLINDETVALEPTISELHFDHNGPFDRFNNCRQWTAFKLFFNFLI